MFKIVAALIWLAIVCFAANYIASNIAYAMDNMANAMTQVN